MYSGNMICHSCVRAVLIFSKSFQFEAGVYILKYKLYNICSIF